MSATRIITNAWQVRTLPDIFYEEKEPIEDGMLQDVPIRRIAHLLWERYEDRPDVFISGEVFISYDITDGNRRVGPDLFIAFDVNSAGIRGGPAELLDLGDRKGAGLRDGSGVRPARRRTTWAGSGSCTGGWRYRNTGGSTPRAGSCTGGR